MIRSWRYLGFFRTLLDPKKEVCPERVEGLGLLAVKISQMYAVRADLIGYEKSKQLRSFFEDAKAVPPDEIERRFRQLAPRALLEALAHWERSPAATASVGQVHRGVLRDGSKVAIKIIKQDAREEFRAQVRSLRSVLKFILFFYPKLGRVADPLGVLESVEQSTLRELDLRSEAEGIERLGKLRDEGLQKLPHLAQLAFPKVHHELSNADLLVSEWRSEPSLNDLIAAGEFPYDDVLSLFRIHGYFLFLRGTFHGDLHPGNVLFRDGKFVFLDNANVERAPVELTSGILGLLSSLGANDIGAAAEHIASLSTEPLSSAKRQQLHAGMERLYDGFEGKPVGEASLTQQMMATVKLAVDCGVAFPEKAFPVIKSLMTLDGIVGEVAPEAVLLEDTRRFDDDLQLQWCA